MTKYFTICILGLFLTRSINAAFIELAAESDTSLSELRQQCLVKHNQYRALHGTAAVQLSEKLNQFASEWAQHLVDRDAFEHRPNNAYGENLYYTSGNLRSGDTPVTAWYDEIKDYDYNKTGFSMKAGHFTQVIWKNSKEIGVGIATGKNGATIVVVNYNPAGNYWGEFKENVLPVA